MNYGFGIDIGGTTIKGGLFDEMGTVCEKWSVPTRLGENGAYIYDDIAAMVKETMAKAGLSEKDIRGVGVTIPGPIREDGRVMKCANLRVVESYPAKEISARLDGIPVKAVNDANAAAFGEKHFGAGREFGSLCMVTLGTGVGGGVVWNGKIVGGSHGAGGEIGHMPVMDGEMERCGCGSCGCCETYASATGIVRVAKRLAANGDPRVGLIPGKPFKYPDCRIAKNWTKLSAKMICDLTRDGDELAKKALSFSMEQLAKALVCVMYTVDPEAFVIGGGVSAAFDVLEPLLRKELVRRAPLIAEKEIKLLPAALGNDAGIFGAAALFLM